MKSNKKGFKIIKDKKVYNVFHYEIFIGSTSTKKQAIKLVVNYV